MPTTRTVTSVTSTGVATHVINITGFAGIIFWSVLAAMMLYLVGFFTTGWQIRKNGDASVKHGLWDSCYCGGDVKHYDDDTWFEATQGMAVLGFIFLSLACVAVTNYMFFTLLSKSLTLKLTIGLTFAAVAFILLALIIFGAEASKNKYGGGGLHYSYALCAMAAIGSLVAGVISVMQLFRANSA